MLSCVSGLNYVLTFKSNVGQIVISFQMLCFDIGERE